MRTFNAILAVADISGYTRFVVQHRASLMHAEQIVSELMETVASQAKVPLTLHKLEGDAAFMVAEVTGSMAEAANDVMAQITAFNDGFEKKKTELFEKSIGGCPCTACQTIETLGLKTVVHSGEVLEKSVGGFTELAGTPVIVAHRLLKNSVEGRNYVLATDEVAALLDAPPYPASRAIVEDVTDVGQIRATAWFPDTPALDRGGVAPMTRISGRIEAMRLFAARGLARLRGGKRAFNHLGEQPG